MNEEVKRIIIYAVLLCSLILLLTSCSAKWHIRQAVKKNSSLFDTITTVKTDTIYIQDVLKDTIVKYLIDVQDSIIFQDRTKLRYIIKSDTAYFEVDCPDNIIVTDSIFIDRAIKVHPTFIQNIKSLWWMPLIFLIIFVALIILIKK